MSDLWNDLKEYGRTEWKAILVEAHNNYVEISPWNKGKKGLQKDSEETKQKKRLAKLGKKEVHIRRENRILKELRQGRKLPLRSRG